MRAIYGGNASTTKIFGTADNIKEVDLVARTGTSVQGQVVRILRIPDPDLSGTEGQGRVSELIMVTQLCDVTAFIRPEFAVAACFYQIVLHGGPHYQ